MIAALFVKIMTMKRILREENVWEEILREKYIWKELPREEILAYRDIEVITDINNVIEEKR